MPTPKRVLRPVFSINNCVIISLYYFRVCYLLRLTTIGNTHRSGFGVISWLFVGIIDGHAGADARPSRKSS